MTLRISTERTPITTFKLAGRLEREAVAALERSCGGAPDRYAIDLSEVSFADDAGIEVLKGLRSHGAALCGARPYLALLLEDSGSAGAERRPPSTGEGFRR